MIEARLKVVEQLALTIREQKLRTVSFASRRFDPDTSALVCAIAEVTGRAGVETLVIDLTGGRGMAGNLVADESWSPRADAGQVTASGLGFDVIGGARGDIGRAAFNDSQIVRNSIAERFSMYSLILLDLPGLADDELEYPNAVAGAAACDGVVLVCATGEVETGLMHDAIERVRAAGGKIRGTVLDDRSNPTIGFELQRFFKRLPFTKRLRTWAVRSSMLNVPIYS